MSVIHVYRCGECGIVSERRVRTEQRDAQACEWCFSALRRLFTPAWVAPVGGIPNRLNRHWREGGRRVDTPELEQFIEGADKP